MTATTREHLPLSWPTILFILGTSLGAVAWPVYAYFYGVTAGEVALAAAYFVAAGMSITVGYHRLIAHRSFKCRRWLEAVFLIAGSAAWQGSALSWASDHVRHHGYTDTHRDPYNINQGVWYAHIGWLFRKTPAAAPPEFLSSDPLVAWQHRYYVPLAVVTSFVVPYMIAGTGGLLLAGVVRIVVGHHATWLINSWAHVGSRRPYAPDVSATDNWLLAFFTFGEGWHNYHHAFPHDYRNGVAKLAWDPSKWLVWALSLVGVTYELKTIGPVRRWQQRVVSAIGCEAELDEKLARLEGTRLALEKQLEHSRVRLEGLLERSIELDPTSPANLGELRERLARRLAEERDRLSRASRRRLERARELADAVEAYCGLLERLRDCRAQVLDTDPAPLPS